MGTQSSVDPEIGLAVSWIIPPKIFCILRFLFAAYVWEVNIIININPPLYLLANIYLTSQALLCCAIYLLLSFCCTLIFAFFFTKQRDKCVQLCRCTKIFQIMASSLSLTVAIGYWTILGDSDALLSSLNIQIHGVTAILTVIDFYLCFSTICFKSTWWYFMIYGILYTLFSVIYNFATNEAIYPALDWKEYPLSAVGLCAGIIVSSVVIHFVLCWTKNKLIEGKRRKIEKESNEQDINMDEHINHSVIPSDLETKNKDDIPSESQSERDVDKYTNSKQESIDDDDEVP